MCPSHDVDDDKHLVTRFKHLVTRFRPTMPNTAVILPTAATLVLLVYFFPRHSAVAAPAVLPTTGGSTEQTYYYRNEEQLTHVSHIIDALEALGVLVSRKTCYTLEKITKMPVSKGTHQWKIGIFLYMSEAERGTPLDGGRNPSRPDTEGITLPDYNCCENALNNSTEDISVTSNRSHKHDPDVAADSQGTWVEGKTHTIICSHYFISDTPSSKCLY